MPDAIAPTSEEIVDLKDPALAAFLAWLIPGLGHWYQGRYAKAVLFFVCIMGTFVYGVYLGGSRELGWGRTVYFSWRDSDRRLAYFCQVGIGMLGLPALVQANRMANNQSVFWHGFMAPPLLANSPNMNERENPNRNQPTLSELHVKLHRFFELGTVFTMIGGLLNILAIYDAWGGPVIIQPKKKGKKEEETFDGKATEAQPVDV